MSKNSVLEGTYKGCLVNVSNGVISIGSKIICKHDIIRYEIITEEKRKSGTSAILRGATGIALLGGIGVLAALTAKDKKTYIVAIEWNSFFLNSKDKKKGDKSLLEIDDKIYNAFVKMML